MASQKYPNLLSDHCECSNGAVSVQIPPLNPQPIATTASYQQHHFHCKKFATVMAIANHQEVDYGIPNCVKGSSYDGFVQAECNVTSVNEWRKGMKVYPKCDIPWYTPVAVFDPNSDTYDPTNGQSGIFAGCLPDGLPGFKLITEECKDYPKIVHIIINGSSAHMPEEFFVIN